MSSKFLEAPLLLALLLTFSSTSLTVLAYRANAKEGASLPLVTILSEGRNQLLLLREEECLGRIEVDVSSSPHLTLSGEALVKFSKSAPISRLLFTSTFSENGTLAATHSRLSRGGETLDVDVDGKEEAPQVTLSGTFLGRKVLQVIRLDAPLSLQAESRAPLVIRYPFITYAGTFSLKALLSAVHPHPGFYVERVESRAKGCEEIAYPLNDLQNENDDRRIPVGSRSL